MGEFQNHSNFIRVVRILFRWNIKLDPRTAAEISPNICLEVATDRPFQRFIRFRKGSWSKQLQCASVSPKIRLSVCHGVCF